MQKDFHYDAVYVLARCAGLSPPASSTIATASEYVDEAVSRQLPGAEGLAIVPDVTAHRVSDLKENTDSEDQRQVWVPFHFLPGGEGASLSERLVCLPDSPVARAVVQHAVDACTKSFGLELVGITAHVYADTFAHWGFSGVSSRRNRVKPGSVVAANDHAEAATFFGPKLHALLNRLAPATGNLIPNFRAALTGAANLGSLGHAAVASSPDQPFLAWSYEYESFSDIPPRAQDRFNLDFYIQAAEKLHAFFAAIRARRAGDADSAGQPFSAIREPVRRVLTHVGDASARSAVWKSAAARGAFGPTGPIPEYGGQVMEASRQALARLRSVDESDSQPTYRFYQAATKHRWFVLRDLLPEHGIVLI